MAVAVVTSRALAGINAPEVVVEAHLANGLPGFTLVGLPETEVKEARDRVRAAIQNARFEFPARRITVNLAPADLPKESGRFDLPIALAILAASGQIPADKLSVKVARSALHPPSPSGGRDWVRDGHGDRRSSFIFRGGDKHHDR